ncbi:MAG: GDSL-type esterase/lipase family protein [Oscillospiraceae bacterium]
MGDNRNPGKIPPNRRPQRRRRKNDVPPAVIAIYVVMALLILAICAIVFVVTLKNTNDSNASGDGSSSLVISVDNSSQNSSSVVSSTESTTDSSAEDPNSSTVESTTSSSNTSSSSVEVLPVYSTVYSKEYFSDDLFIGDSIFTGLSGYGYIDAENVAAKIGYTPSGAMNKAFDAKGVSAVEYAKSRQPKCIYIMLGSNTMAAGTNYDVIVSQYKELVNKLKAECPKSEICVISIPPVTSDSSSAKAGNITNENIRKVNTKLKAMAAELDEEYFDLNSMLSDSKGYFREDYAEQDGLHFKGSTYKVMLSALQNDTTWSSTVIYTTSNQ